MKLFPIISACSTLWEFPFEFPPIWRTPKHVSWCKRKRKKKKRFHRKTFCTFFSIAENKFLFWQLYLHIRYSYSRYFRESEHESLVSRKIEHFRFLKAARHSIKPAARNRKVSIARDIVVPMSFSFFFFFFLPCLFGPFVFVTRSTLTDLGSATQNAQV